MDVRDRPLRRHEVHLRQPRGAREERLHRHLDPRREHAADVLPGRGDGVEVRRRPEVDHDARRAVALARRDGVHDPVRADLARVVVPDRDAGPRPRADHEERRLRVPLGELGVRPLERRDRRREAHGGHVLEAEVPQLEEPGQERRRARPRSARPRWPRASARRAGPPRRARRRSGCSRRRPRAARGARYAASSSPVRVSPSFSASVSGVSAGSSPSPRSSSIVTSLDV